MRGAGRSGLLRRSCEVAPGLDTFVPFEFAIADLESGWYAVRVRRDGGRDRGCVRRAASGSACRGPDGAVRRGSVDVGKELSGAAGRVAIEQIDCGGDRSTVHVVSDPPVEPSLRLSVDGTPLPVLDAADDPDSGAGTVAAYPVLRSPDGGPDRTARRRRRGRAAAVAVSARLDIVRRCSGPSSMRCSRVVRRMRARRLAVLPRCLRGVALCGAAVVRPMRPCLTRTSAAMDARDCPPPPIDLARSPLFVPRTCSPRRPPTEVLRVARRGGRPCSGDGHDELHDERTSARRGLTGCRSSKARQVRRGFDQAEALAIALASRLDLPAIGMLRRLRDPGPQALRGGAERRAAMHGAFAIVGEAPERVLLVDDVLTTGATAGECARVLSANGAGTITLMTAVRAHPGAVARSLYSGRWRSSGSVVARGTAPR